MTFIQPIRTRAACARPATVITAPVASHIASPGPGVPRSLARDAFDAALVMATALSAALPDEAARDLARTFTTAVVTEVWQRQAPGLSLRPAFTGAATVVLDANAADLALRFGDLLHRCDPETASAGFGEIYTAILPRTLRKKHGIYYTPPALADLVSARATDARLDWRTARVLEPACGGGAILLPALRRMRDALRTQDPQTVLDAISRRLRGCDLDPFAAWLAQVSVDLALVDEVLATGRPAPLVIRIGDSLDNLGGEPEAPYDAVLGNPPYGQLRLSPAQKICFARSTYGRANLYGLFFDRATELVRPGGVICYLTPTAYLGGEYFKHLRRHLSGSAPPVSLDFLVDRRGVYSDALQETVLTTCRRGASPGQVALSEVRITEGGVETRPIARVACPAAPEQPWPFPRRAVQAPYAPNLLRTPACLADWGYTVRTGPIDGSDRTRDTEPGPGAVPLIWPEAVSAAGLDWPAVKRGRSAWYLAEGREHLLVRAPCVLLQRTTALEQARRLVATPLDADFLTGHGPCAVENHLNLLEPTGIDAVPAAVLAAYLNSGAADAAFRCLSGTTAVSAFELRALALPAPDRLGPLAALVMQGATRAEIEFECARLIVDPAARQVHGGPWTQSPCAEAEPGRLREPRGSKPILGRPAPLPETRCQFQKHPRA